MLKVVVLEALYVLPCRSAPSLIMDGAFLLRNGTGIDTTMHTPLQPVIKSYNRSHVCETYPI